MKTTRLTLKFTPNRFREPTGVIDAGLEVDVTYDRDSQKLRVKGPKIDLLIDDVEAFDLTHVELGEKPPS